MGFGQLPAELLLHIFSYLDRKDLKVARACCTAFRDNCSPDLFRSVVACARYQALGAVEKIARHETFKTYVKEIVFDGSVYDKGLASRMETYVAECKNHPELAGITSWERPRRYQRYRELFDEQESIRTGHVMLQTLARALEDMPNVSTIVYSPGPLLVPVEAKYVRDIIPRGATTRYASFIHAPLEGNSPNEYIERKQHGIHHLIAAIHLAQYRGIREFRVEEITFVPVQGRSLTMSGTQFTVFVFDFPPGPHLDAGKFFFSQLHRLNMRIPLLRPGTDAYCFSDASETCLANFKTLLAEATELRELELRIREWPRYNEYIGHELGFTNTIFKHIGLDSAWPHLRKLTLGGIRAKEEQFHELIFGHIDTLTELRFELCTLSSGFWANLVEEVVYGCSRIMPFTLSSVKEGEVNEVPFDQLPHHEQEAWRYRGVVRVNAEGQRYWDEPGGHINSVYAIRSQPDIETAAEDDMEL